MLTVIGFSVHDTIVVFDRIRENRARHAGEPFDRIVNHSILQTFGRSITTSLTVVITLLALLLFAGEAIGTFVLALLHRHHLRHLLVDLQREPAPGRLARMGRPQAARASRGSPEPPRHHVTRVPVATGTRAPRAPPRRPSPRRKPRISRPWHPPRDDRRTPPLGVPDPLHLEAEPGRRPCARARHVRRHRAGPPGDRGAARSPRSSALPSPASTIRASSRMRTRCLLASPGRARAARR